MVSLYTRHRRVIKGTPSIQMSFGFLKGEISSFFVNNTFTLLLQVKVIYSL